MKKILVLTIIFTIALSAGLFGQAARNWYQKIVLTPPGDIFDYVTNTGTTHSANYRLEADILETTGEVISTDTFAAPYMRIVKLGTGASAWAAAYLNLSNFPTPWAAGQTLRLTITYLATSEVASHDVVIPAGTNNVLLNQPGQEMIVPPMPATSFTLTVTSTPAGQPIWKDGVDTAQVTPWTFDPGEAGTYTVVNTGYTWEPVSHVVPELTENTTIDFQGTEIDTYMYNLYVTGPDGYAVMHVNPVLNGTTDYMVSSATQADLFGDYTIAAAPAGFHWVFNPITVNGNGWTQVTKKGAVAGTRTAAPKAHIVHEKTIEFVLEADPPTYDFPQGGAPAPLPGAEAGNTIAFTAGNANLGMGVPTPPTNPLFAPGFVQFLTLVSPGPWDFQVVTTYDWIWIVGVGVYAGPGTINIHIDGAKDEIVEMQGGGGGDPTLPVELSSFTAVLTANNFVKLTWVSQSETEMLGYRVYRGESGDQASAIMITPTMEPATNTSTTQTYSITDNEVTIGSTYWYWLESVDYASSHFHGPVSIIVEGEVPPVLPETTTMKNAYPNPFRMNSSTTIDVAVKAGENGIVTIYNILGQAVKTFKVSEGTTKINWNGRDAKGNACGSGIYFYKLSTPSMNQTKKMVIVK